MQKVISINLNGHAYQLEEGGYDRLREYLGHAERALKDNPDRVEILSDLEQAIGEKCRRYLGPHKSVVSTDEIDQIVREMGPVEPSASTDDSATSATRSSSSTRTAGAASTRLYRIMDGAMIAGVCNGIAAYFKIDVTIVRVAFVIAALVTRGIGIFAYVAAMFVLPEASTPEERAAASGSPFNAKEVIDRAKKHYAEGSKHWRRQWRRQRREWRRHAWGAGPPHVYGPPPLPAMLLPVFGLAHLTLFMLAVAMMISLVNTGAILSWRLPEDVPVWAGALMLLIGYQIATTPIRAMQHWSWRPSGGVEPGWYAFWNMVVWLSGLALAVWVASNHLPEIREFLGKLPQLFREAFYAFRDLLSR
jgi:phage shock protein PspC (stress-responsive transcriptional regulator)